MNDLRELAERLHTVAACFAVRAERDWDIHLNNTDVSIHGKLLIETRAALLALLDERDKLTTERDDLLKTFREDRQFHELKADAERYQWLRLNGDAENVCDSAWRHMLKGEELDEAVDRARAP